MTQIQTLNEKLWKQIFVEHILSDIKWAIDSERYIAAAQLLYAAIDVASGLERPVDKNETNGDIFINWCNINMNLRGEKHAITGLDLWGARCGFLHGYTPVSRTYNNGNAKLLAYVDQAEELVMFDKNVANDFAIVSLRGLLSSFCNALSNSVARIKADQESIKLVNGRLQMMFHNMPLSEKFKNL